MFSLSLVSKWAQIVYSLSDNHYSLWCPNCLKCGASPFQLAPLSSPFAPVDFWELPCFTAQDSGLFLYLHNPDEETVISPRAVFVFIEGLDLETKI